MASLTLRRPPAGRIAWTDDVAPLYDVLLGYKGGGMLLRGHDGQRLDQTGGAVRSAGNYVVDVQSKASGGKHAAFVLSGTSETAAPTPANSVLLIEDAGLSIGAGTGLRIYESGGTDYALMTSSDGLLTVGGVGANAGSLALGGALQLAEIATPSSPPASSQKLYAKTGLLSRLTSAGVESRMLDASQFTAGGQLIYGSANNTATVLAAGTATQVLHGGTALTWSQVVNADIATTAAIDPLKLGADAYVALNDTTDQTVSSGSIKDLTWATEVADVWGFHAAGSANLVIPTGYGGIYVAVLTAVWEIAGNGTRQFQIYLDGAAVGASVHPALTSAGFTSCLALFQATAGQTVKAIAYQDSTGGVSVKVLGTASSGSKFRMARVGT